MAKRAVARSLPDLITNTQIVTEDCRWCPALAGVDVHDAYCPCGERAKQIQDMGGLGRCDWKHDMPEATNV